MSDDERLREVALAALQRQIEEAWGPEAAADNFGLKMMEPYVGAMVSAIMAELQASLRHPDTTTVAPHAKFLPHSRACGIQIHEHGPACDRNCPTCGGQDAAPAKAETLVCIGGPLHGREVDVAPGTANYVDLEHAETYVRRKLVAVEPKVGGKAFWRHAFVHGAFPIDQAPQALANHLFSIWVRESGEFEPSVTVAFDQATGFRLVQTPPAATGVPILGQPQ